MRLTTTGSDQRERVAYDLVVVAIGFDARWFDALLGRDARRRLENAVDAELERRIDVDLSIAGLSPPLHLPVLAGLAPGARLPESQLSGPSERPHPAPLCPN
jgi:mycobactin lysine-N-oxygenase